MYEVEADYDLNKAHGQILNGSQINKHLKKANNLNFN